MTRSHRTCNLEPIQRIALVEKGEDLIAARAKEQQGTRTDLLVNLPKSPPIDTRKEAAKLANVSERTYDKGVVVLKKATPDPKQPFFSLP